MLKFKTRFLYTNRIEEKQSYKTALNFFYRNRMRIDNHKYFAILRKKILKFANCAMFNMFQAIQMKDHTNRMVRALNQKCWFA